jgi:hypothetical protein
MPTPELRWIKPASFPARRRAADEVKLLVQCVPEGTEWATLAVS